MSDVEKRAETAVVPHISYAVGDTVEVPGKNGDQLDIGFGLFQQSHQYNTAQLERDAVKVRRKLDFIVLPMVCNLCINWLALMSLDDDNVYAIISRQADV